MTILEELEKQKKIVDQALERYLDQKIRTLPSFDDPLVKEQYRLLRDYCLRDSKRLRPILTLAAYRAVGGKKVNNILLPALAFELFHNYTLVHDDIYDEDEKRRGQWSNHILLQRWFERKYGKSLSKNILFKNNATRFGVVAGIINGKYLHSLSEQIILEAKISDKKKIDGLALHQSASFIDNTGQTIDLYFEEASHIQEKDYYDMVLCKTGKLFESAILWGAILGDATVSQKKALSNYIREVAIVFQIQDDLLDIDLSGGKRRAFGSDIRKGKKTLLMIHALEKANSAERRGILQVLGDEKAPEQKIRKIIKLLEKLGSVVYCKTVAERRIKKAIHYLESASPAFNDESKRFFSDLAYFMLERKK